MKSARLLVFALLVAVVSSCSPMKGITVSKVENMEVGSLEGNKVSINLVAKVDNPNKRNIKIKKVDFF